KKRLSFAERACRTFRTGSPELRKDIMMELQSQIIVKDKGVKLDLDPLLNLFFKKPNQKDIEKLLVRTKTNEVGTNIFELFFSSNSIWGGVSKSPRTFFYL